MERKKINKCFLLSWWRVEAGACSTEEHGPELDGGVVGRREDAVGQKLEALDRRLVPFELAQQLAGGKVPHLATYNHTWWLEAGRAQGCLTLVRAWEGDHLDAPVLAERNNDVAIGFDRDRIDPLRVAGQRAQTLPSLEIPHLRVEQMSTRTRRR